MKYAIFGNYGHSNIGDEAILRGLLSLLKNREIIVYTDSEKNSSLIHGETCNFKLLKTPLRQRYYLIPLLVVQLFSAVMKNNIIIVGGGGLFNQLNKTSFFQYFLIILFSRLLFKKTIIFGVSVGPLNKKSLKMLLGIISLCADEVYVRDASSVKYFNKSKTDVIPDLSLGANIDQTSNKSNVFNVVISLMDVSKSQNAQVESAYIDKMGEFIKSLSDIDKEVHVELIAMDYHKDLEVISRVSERVQENTVKCGVVAVNSFDVLDCVFQKADFVLATRLHSAILSILYKKPFVAISYQPKVMDYLVSHGLKEAAIDIENIKDIDLYELLKNTMSKLQRKNNLSNLSTDSLRKLQQITEGFS